MSVIGIDFGNEGCYVACAKAGGIETLANDYSLRATPSFVAFDGKKRIIGVAAKNQQVTNMKNTVSGFKRLLGRKFNDPHVQRELSIIPTRIELLTDGGIGYRVNYLDKEQLFTPEQLTAMLFTKLKETSSQAIQAQVNDCVICCPIYYTNAERRALLDAAQIAGLNVLRLMNETTATALSYGFYKNDLREDKARNVIFVDCGHSSLQVSACAFSKGKLKMLASTWDHIGGRDFDSVLAEHFIKEFNERYKLNVKKDARAYLRLLTELEKVKKQMSANSTKLPINIECFMNDIDVSSSMQRTKMEELCDHLFERVAVTFKRLLQESKLSLDDIHSVEIVGGSSRIPAIKQLIEQIFGKPASTTLNQDESVARGATLQCAIMSPGVRVRDFGVTDIQNYPIKVSWDAEGSVSAGEVELFPAFHPAPFSRLLTLHRREPFTIIIQYAPSVPYPDLVIGHGHIKDVKPNDKGEYQEVKVKVRINLHGVVVISNAALVDKKEIEEATVSAINEQTMAANNDDKPSSNAEQQQSAGEPMDIVQEGTDKKKKSTKWIELPLKFKTHGLSPTELNNLMHLETKMVASDTQERERVDARNALEEYVYDMRNKLQGGPFEDYIVVSERDMICNELDDIESWLYDDGEECERDTYVNKLKALYARTDVVKQRAYDYQYCPAEFDELTNAIHYSRTVIKECRKGLPVYEHLTETDLINMAEAADKAQNWLEDKFGEFTKASRITDSPVKIDEIRNEVQALYNCVNSVINRPKVKCTTANTTTPSSNSAHGNANNNTKAGSASTQGQNGDTTATHHRADETEGTAPDESYDLTMDVE